MELEEHELSSLFPGVAAQLRSTLTSLHLAAAQLAPAADRERDPELDLRAARIDQSYYQLLRLVNNLSLAACLADGQVTPPKNLDIVQAVSQLCEQTGSLAERRGLKLCFLCPMEQHLCAVSREMLEQIVYHLLSNAFKFTSAGGTVTVSLRRIPGKVVITAEDTGPGISREKLNTLFDRDFRQDHPLPPPQGPGLGLPLCHRLAKAYGGTLVAESTLGRGSRFTLSLPDRQAEPDVSDIPMDYTGGFNPALLALADALPAEVFLLREQN